MSPDDQRAQKGAVLLEFQEVTDQIKALEIKAERLGEKIAQFGNLLKHHAAHSIMKEDQAHHGLAIGPTSPELLAAMRGWQDSFEITESLRLAMHRLTELKRQKAQLGLP